MEKRHVPKLRFKGFEYEWEENYLKDIATIVGGGTPPTNKNEYWSGDVQWFTPSEIGDSKYVEKSNRTITELGVKKSSAKILPKGTILLTTRATLGEMAILKNDATTNQGFQSLIVKNEFSTECIYYLKDKISKFCYKNSSGSTFLEISKSNLEKFKVKLPSLEEQTKIANFLSNVDNIIEEQEGKVKDLELYKKGMMQKIFKQEIRFKDDNGQDYPKWEEKKLGVLGSTYTGLSGKTKEDFGFGKGRYITYMNVFKNIRTDIRMIDLVDIKENENQNTVLKGDLLFTTSSETPQEVGMVSVCDNDIKGLYLNSFCFGFRFNELSNVNSYFMASYLRSPEIRMKISILAQGSTRYNLSKTELMKIKLLIPCLAEQTKIDNLLSNIDKIIKEENKKLEDLRQWKKGLLQQMFV